MAPHVERDHRATVRASPSWTAVGVIMLGALIMAIAVVIASTWLFVVGAVVVVLGGIARQGALGDGLRRLGPRPATDAASTVVSCVASRSPWLVGGPSAVGTIRASTSPLTGRPADCPRRHPRRRPRGPRRPPGRVPPRRAAGAGRSAGHRRVPATSGAAAPARRQGHRRGQAGEPEQGRARRRSPTRPRWPPTTRPAAPASSAC